MKTHDRPERSDYSEVLQMDVVPLCEFLVCCLQPNLPKTINWKFSMVITICKVICQKSVSSQRQTADTGEERQREMLNVSIL